MRPDVLTLLRFAISAQLFIRLLRASQTPPARTHISIRSHAQPFFFFSPPQSLPQSDLSSFFLHCVYFIWCQHIKVPNHQSERFLLGAIYSATPVICNGSNSYSNYTGNYSELYLVKWLLVYFKTYNNCYYLHLRVIPVTSQETGSFRRRKKHTPCRKTHEQTLEINYNPHYLKEK